MPENPTETGQGCTCQACGRLFRHDFIVPPDVWRRISPRPEADGAGLLCGPCTTQRIEQLSDFGAWYIEVISIAVPPWPTDRRPTPTPTKHVHLEGGGCDSPQCSTPERAPCPGRRIFKHRGHRYLTSDDQRSAGWAYITATPRCRYCGSTTLQT